MRGIVIFLTAFLITPGAAHFEGIDSSRPSSSASRLSSANARYVGNENHVADVSCGQCKTWQYVDIYMIDTWMEHAFVGAAQHDDANAEDAGQPALAHLLDQSLLGGPSDLSAFGVTSRRKPDYNLLGQVLRNCDNLGCHTWYEYDTCFEVHNACPGEDFFDEDRIRADLTKTSIAQTELKLRMLVEQARAIVTDNAFQLLKCNGALGVSIPLTPNLRAALARIKSGLVTVESSSTWS